MSWKEELLKRLPKDESCICRNLNPRSRLQLPCCCGARGRNEALAEVRKIIEGMELEAKETEIEILSDGDYKIIHGNRAMSITTRPKECSGSCFKGDKFIIVARYRHL